MDPNICVYFKECCNNILCPICIDYNKLKLKKKPQKRKGPIQDWKKAEKKVQKKTGGRLTPASGAFGIKGDIQTKDKIVEVKSTSKPYISLKGIWLDNLQTQAKNINKSFLLVLSIKTRLFYVTEIDPIPECKELKESIRIYANNPACVFKHNEKYYRISTDSNY